MIELVAIQEFRASVSTPSPNHNQRPPGARISCVVLHATADDGNEAGAESWLCRRESQASSHLVIRRDGIVVRLVPDRLRAWHAGVSAFRGERDVNDFSLGWEMANRNDGVEPFTDAQYSAVALLAAHYIKQGLKLGDFVGHDEVALPPGRKTDPRGFDWTRFVRTTLANSADQNGELQLRTTRQ